jgi:hypothetical protein
MGPSLQRKSLSLSLSFTVYARHIAKDMSHVVIPSCCCTLCAFTLADYGCGWSNRLFDRQEMSPFHGTITIFPPSLCGVRSWQRGSARLQAGLTIVLLDAGQYESCKIWGFATPEMSMKVFLVMPGTRWRH